MKTIGYLDCFGCAETGALGIDSLAIAADSWRQAQFDEAIAEIGSKLPFSQGNAGILEHPPFDQVIEGAFRRVVLDQRQGFLSLKVKVSTVVKVGGAKA